MGLMDISLKIMFWLVLAGLLGWIIGFLLGRILGSANEAELLNDYEGKLRMRDLELNGLRNDLTAANAKMNSLESELSTLVVTLKTREKWVIELEAKNTELHADLDARIDELDLLKAESDRAQAELKAQLEAVKTEARSENEAWQPRLAVAERTVEAAQQTEEELKALRRSFAAKEKEWALLRQQAADLEAQVREAKTAEAEVGQLKAQITSLLASKSLLGERDAEIARLRLCLSELEPLVVEVQQREAKIRELHTQIQTRDDELARLRKQLVASDTLSELLQQRDASLRDGELRYKALERERDAEIARLKVHITELEMMARDVKKPVIKVTSPSAMLAAAKERDDLKKIFGIGPVLEKLLNSHGIYWFQQIAEWSAEDVQHYDKLLEDFRGRIVRDNWISSAREEYLKKYGEQL